MGMVRLPSNDGPAPGQRGLTICNLGEQGCLPRTGCDRSGHSADRGDRPSGLRQRHLCRQGNQRGLQRIVGRFRGPAARVAKERGVSREER